MPDLKLQVGYTFNITAEEFRLISAALLAVGGAQAFRESWKPGAMALQSRLFEQRAAQVAAFAEEIGRQTPAILPPAVPRGDSP